MRKTIAVTMVLALVIVTLLAACSQPAPTATAAPAKPTATPPTATQPSASPKPTATAAPTPAKLQVPDPLVISTYEVGSTGYLFSAGVGEAITKATGVKVRAIPTSMAPARTGLLVQGRAHMITAGDTMVEGLEEYARMEWGPQPLRLLYNTFMVGQGIYVRGDSNINKMSDLRGKKVDWRAGINQLNVTAALAFGGLTTKDVDTSVASTGGAQSADMLKMGKVDAFSWTIDAAFMLELETMQGGLRAIPMPPEDAEGWARLHKVQAWLTPRLADPKDGAGFNGKPTWIWSKSYPTLSTLDSMDDNLAYWITKTVLENYPLFKDYNSQTRISTPEAALDVVGRVIVPYHEGSIKYFKEKGLWTDRHEKWNNALLERQTMLRTAFDKALADAAQQKVKEADFAKFWMQNRPPVIDVEDVLKKAGL